MFCNISNKSEKTVWISPIQSLLLGNVLYITLQTSAVCAIWLVITNLDKIKFTTIRLSYLLAKPWIILFNLKYLNDFLTKQKKKNKQKRKHNKQKKKKKKKKKNINQRFSTKKPYQKSR